MGGGSLKVTSGASNTGHLILVPPQGFIPFRGRVAEVGVELGRSVSPLGLGTSSEEGFEGRAGIRERGARLRGLFWLSPALKVLHCFISRLLLEVGGE